MEAGIIIAEVWIVNLVDRQIEIYTEPQAADYLTRTTRLLTSEIAPQRFPHDAAAWLPEAIFNVLNTSVTSVFLAPFPLPRLLIDDEFYLLPPQIDLLSGQVKR